MSFLPLDWRKRFSPIGAIALIRQRWGIRSRKKDGVVLRGAIRKPRTQDNRHLAPPIRDVPCARLRVSVAEVEHKAGPSQERLEKRSSSCKHHRPPINGQPLRVRRIFPCHSRGDLPSLFRDRPFANEVFRSVPRSSLLSLMSRCEVVVDGRKIFSRMSFAHCEAIDFLGYVRYG